MRIIDYYNLLALFLYILLILLYIRKPNYFSKYENKTLIFKKSTVGLFHFRYSFYCFFAFFLILGIFLRFYQLTALPPGLHQDEASNAYEAFALSTYGMDRNGYHYPIYPITFGSGGGSPFLIYLTSLFVPFCTKAVTPIRYIIAGSGCIALILFYIYLKITTGDKFLSLLGMGLLALIPWHIILSRWALDSNLVPTFQLLILVFFFLGNKTQKTIYYLFAAFWCALGMYNYGSSNFIIPPFMLLACIYSLWTKRISIKQLFFSGILFCVTVFPLGCFYIINFLDLPAIETAWFSIPKLTSDHLNSIFGNQGLSLLDLLKTRLLGILGLLTWGRQDEQWNYIPGYFTLFQFTFPITFLGIYSSFKKLYFSLKSKEYSNNSLMLCMFIPALLFAAIIDQNINRTVYLYLPLVFFMTIGFFSLKQYSNYYFSIAFILFFFAFLSFGKDYFTKYADQTSFIFMKGYGEAVAYAEETHEEGTLIYSTYTNLSSPFVSILLYTKTPPEEYIDTVKYRNDLAEFRVATSFTHYVLALPENVTDEKYSHNTLIIEQGERAMFSEEDYVFTQFGNYIVLQKNKEEAM